MDMISKKDLLALTGISYGQLYRWKRENLIPEEWFIKQSSYTGQETFFPRDQVLSRVQTILEAKDAYSLEELSKILAPEATVISVTSNELCIFVEIDTKLRSIINLHYKKEHYELFDLILFVAISQSIQKLGLTNEQSIDLLTRCISATHISKNVEAKYIVFTLGKEYHIAISLSNATVAFDSEIKIVDTCSLGELSNKIKVKYQAQLSKQ